MRLASWVVAVATISASYACSTTEHAEAPETPTGFTFAAIEARSFVSFGWEGSQHNVRVPDGTPFSVKTDNCQGTDGPCQFEGPVDFPLTPINPVERRRCLNQMSMTCHVDMDCPPLLSSTGSTAADHGSCVYIYDPPTGLPLPHADGTIGACAWSYIPPTPPGGPPSIAGSIDQTSGEVTLPTLIVNLALNGQGGAYRGGCAVCVGDNKPNDGMKDGHCMPAPKAGMQVDETSLDDGAPCDVNRQGTFAGYAYSYSMDCSPTVTSDDGAPTPFGGSLSSNDIEMSIGDGPLCSMQGVSEVTLGAAVVKDTENCFCGVCNVDLVTGCHTNADCIAVPGAGTTCGLPLWQNNCMLDMTTGACKTSLTSTTITDGVTMTGPVNEAPTQPSECPGNCNWDNDTGLGTCNGDSTQSCYPDGMGAKIHLAGNHVPAGPNFIVDTGSLRCNGASSSGVLNRQVGLPGLVLQKRSFTVSPTTAQEITP